MSSRVIGIDLGTRTARVVEARLRKGAVELHTAGEFPADDLAGGLAALGLKGVPAAVGITGRDLNLRTTQVPPVPEWQLRELLGYEVDDIAEQMGDDLGSDFALLGGAAAFTDEDMALLALVRTSVVEQRAAELSAAKVASQGLTPNAVALHNAVVATDGGEGTVMVVGLRGQHTDVAVIHEGELAFARNLSGGGQLFTDAVAEEFGVDGAKAEQAKRKLGRFAQPGEQLPDKQARVARALEQPLRQVVAMLQSTVNLCRAQLQAPNLEVDRVLLCGPGAELPGLDTALTRALGMPVHVFDPCEGYVVGDAEELDERGPAYATAAGLAMMALLPGTTRVQVLSDAQRKAKVFKDKTLWLVLAGVLVLVHLGLYGWKVSEDAAAVDRDRSKLTRQVSQRESEVRRYRDAVAEAEQLSARMAVIHDVTAPGSGLLGVLELLDAHLPDELWVTDVSTARSVVPEFEHGGAPHPHVWVRGQGKELDRQLTGALSDLATLLRGHASVAAVVPTFEDNRGRFTFELRIDTSVVPVLDDGADDDDGEGA